MISKKLLLASSITLTFSSGITHSSVEMQAEKEWLKAQHPELMKQERVAYYVRYKKNQDKSSIKAAWTTSLKSMGGKIHHELDDYNMVAISLPKSKISSLKSLPDVEFMEPVPEHKLMAQVTPWNIDQFQARDVWDLNRDGIIDPGAPTGSGVKFCIIDTGFYYDIDGAGPDKGHEDFVGITASGLAQIPGEDWHFDGNGHGTHVAGTANAMNNNIGVVGVMPGGAELYIVKIFDDAGEWSPGNSNLGAAAIACKNAGANAISMSLGGGSSNSENIIFQDLYDNFNIVNIAAAGNDGNNVQSYPAGYPSVISVGALEESEIAVNFSQTPFPSNNPAFNDINVHWDATELSGGGAQVLSTWPTLVQVTNNGVDYSGIQIAETSEGDITQNLVDGGECNTPTDNPAGWNGNIILCERGSIAFSAKMNNVASNGGEAVILYNNEPGSIAATCAGSCTSGATIPGVGVTQADGQFLQSNGIGLSTRVVIGEGSGYNTISGTSMATPGVAAGIAWAWDACGGPSAGITNKELRKLLRDSAKDLSGTQPFDDQAGETNGDEISYGVGYDRVTGWGLVQLKDALELGNQRFGSTCPIGISATPSVIDVCTIPSAPDADYTVTLTDNFTGTSNMTSSGSPAGAMSSFTPASVIFPAKTTTFNVTNLNGLTFASHTISLTATEVGNSSNNESINVTLNTYSEVPSTTLSSPIDSATDVALATTFTWAEAIQADTYTLEIATDMLFSNIIATQADLTGTSHTLSTPLVSDTNYYWRVTAINPCGNQSSQAFSFTTIVDLNVCFIPSVKDIPDSNPTGLSDTGTVLTSGSLDDLDVILKINHSWIGDITVTLTDDSGSSIDLMNRPGYVNSGLGCSGEDINTIFNDGASIDVEDQCDDSPAIHGFVVPDEALSTFNTAEFSGDWTISVTDSVGGDTGTLEEWCLVPTLSSSNPNQNPVVDTAIIDQNNTEGNVINLDTTGNFSDPDVGETATLTFTMTGGMPTGLGFNNGVISGTIANTAAASSPYSVTVIATDTNGASVSDTFAWAVTNANQAPTADNDSYNAIEDTILSVNAANGVLNGDTDPDDNSLTAVLDQNATNGNVNLSPNGSFTYMPNENYCNEGMAADTFTYHANDGLADSNIATVSIQVSCVVDTYNVSVDVINLQGTGFVIQLNATESLQITGNGISVFTTDLNEGDAYSAAVLSHPSDQYCTISNNQGTSINDITLTVNCGPELVFSNGFE